jgi:hypothetical protein
MRDNTIGIFIFVVALFLIIGLLLFGRRYFAFGRLPGDIRYEGKRTQVYIPLVSMLLLSLILSLLIYVLRLVF